MFRIFTADAIVKHLLYQLLWTNETLYESMITTTDLERKFLISNTHTDPKRK